MIKKYRPITIWALLLGSTAGAAFGENAPISRNLAWTDQGNIYHGSIVGRTPVDGITGATPNTHGGTIGVEYNLKGHFIQLMSTYGRTKQTIIYCPPAEPVAGEREIKLYLLDIPVMYNFHFFPKERYGREFPRLILSVGAFGSFVLHQTIVDTTLGSSVVSSWALGPFFRAAYYPWPFRRLQPGVFVEFYRSFVPKVYDDPFFRQNSISGQLGILNSGLSLRF